MPSFLYTLRRCHCTALGVTKRSSAISRLLIPEAAIPATRRSPGVSASTPRVAGRRGRAPGAPPPAVGGPPRPRPRRHQLATRLVGDRHGPEPMRHLERLAQWLTGVLGV